MFFVDKPYISEFFKATVRDNAIPVFGILFIETREENFLEIQNILDSDLNEFITVN